MQTRLPRLFTVRVMVFGCVVLLAFILVSPTLHSYVQQRQQLAQLRSQVAAAQARNDDLQSDLSRWDDPAYVQAQARQRLSFVMPGEKAFRVADPQTVPDVEPAEKSGPSSALDDTGTGPWYQAVWSSVEAAGAQPVPPAGQTDASDTPSDATTDPATPPATTAP
ncbi:FtsB family cell division protein [Cellulomonas alba]|uniref:Septum formation initiator family protein n=1 Tax=Cellulomonas alba TaxID=3053467 RepID=A0ABT7SHC2_9CELL|nr:septum formation initiator family protein [Cellulomonas alba]MDM7855593.1 septum formation initiator family protein [Cellulomonas alba]